MRKLTLLLAIIAMSVNLKAQWTYNTAVNTEVSNYTDSDIDFKSVALRNGKTAIVFWEAVSAPINYELRIQIMSASGTKTLGAHGSLISNTIPMSSYTNYWSLVADSNDNIYVGITATSNANGYVFKLDNQGNNKWTSNGVSLGSAYSVEVLPLSNGDVAVAWLNGSTYNASLQKFDTSGTAVWSNNVTIESGASPANLFELSNGDIVSIYHKLSYGINSTLYAKRFTAAGTSVWSSASQLSTKTTAYNQHYSPAQSGDTIYFGYVGKQGSRFDSYIQRLNPDGSKPWGVNGLDFDVNQTSMEMDTRIAVEEGSPYLWALCTYTNSNQSQHGEYVQKINMQQGTRLFTNNAKSLFPIGSEKTHRHKLYVYDDHAFFLLQKGYNNGVSNTLLDVVMLKSNGDFMWADTSKAVASNTGTNKGRAMINRKFEGKTVVVFNEHKSSNTDRRIYAQRFNDTLIVSSKAEMLSYSTANQDSSFLISSNDSIIVYLPSTQSFPVTEIATFSVSQFASTYVNGVPQQSGVTPNTWNDSITPVVYKVISQDSSTMVNYSVYVKIAKSTTIGIEEAETENPFFFSNPIEDQLIININNNFNDLKIIDINGRVIYTERDVRNRKLNINTSTWNSGVYMIILDSKKTYKLIKL